MTKNWIKSKIRVLPYITVVGILCFTSGCHCHWNHKNIPTPQPSYASPYMNNHEVSNATYSVDIEKQLDLTKSRIQVVLDDMEIVLNDTNRVSKSWAQDMRDQIHAAREEMERKETFNELLEHRMYLDKLRYIDETLRWRSPTGLESIDSLDELQLLLQSTKQLKIYGYPGLLSEEYLPAVGQHYAFPITITSRNTIKAISALINGADYEYDNESTVLFSQPGYGGIDCIEWFAIEIDSKKYVCVLGDKIFCTNKRIYKSQRSVREHGYFLAIEVLKLLTDNPNQRFDPAQKPSGNMPNVQGSTDHT